MIKLRKWFLYEPHPYEVHNFLLDFLFVYFFFKHLSQQFFSDIGFVYIYSFHSEHLSTSTSSAELHHYFSIRWTMDDFLEKPSICTNFVFTIYYDGNFLKPSDKLLFHLVRLIQCSTTTWCKADAPIRRKINVKTKTKAKLILCKP